MRLTRCQEARSATCYPNLSFRLTVIPQKNGKKCWLEDLNLSQDRHEKHKNQTNTLQLQHSAPDLQLHSAARGLQDRAGNRSRGQVAHVQFLESRGQPELRSTQS